MSKSFLKCTLNSDLHGLFKTGFRYLTSEGAVSPHLAYVSGNKYECDYEIYDIPNGYKLLFAFYYTGWNGSHAWIDYKIYNNFTYYSTGKLTVYVKDAKKEDIILDAVICALCVFIKL